MSPSDDVVAPRPRAAKRRQHGCYTARAGTVKARFAACSGRVAGEEFAAVERFLEPPGSAARTVPFADLRHVTVAIHRHRGEEFADATGRAVAVRFAENIEVLRPAARETDVAAVTHEAVRHR